MELIAAFFAALTAFVLLFTLVTPSASPAVRSRLDRYDRSRTEPTDPLARPFVARVGVPLGKRVESAARALFPGSIVARVERWLVLAGEPASIFTFLAAAMVAAGAAAVGVVSALSLGFTGPVLLGAIVAAILAAAIPWVWLNGRVSERQSRIRRALPDAVDLVVTTVEAGMAIDASLAEVGRETEGPLGDEIRLAVREVTLGRSRRDALTAIIERTSVPDLRTFIHAVIQAEQTGIPLGPVLRTQANQLRLKRRQHAEADAQRAPVKMVLVLAGFILPALLMFIMGPAAMRMMDAI